MSTLTVKAIEAPVGFDLQLKDLNSISPASIETTTIETTTIETATLNLDGTAEGSPAEGDIWYDNGKFYLGTSQSFSGVWNSGGNLGNQKRDLAGAGTQSAGLCMGGDPGSSYTNSTEEYDGTSWSAGGDLITARKYLAGAGTQSAGLCMGGDTGSVSNVTEEYNAPANFNELFTGVGGL